jgi:hypothetical protein
LMSMRAVEDVAIGLVDIAFPAGAAGAIADGGFAPVAGAGV